MRCFLWTRSASRPLGLSRPLGSLLAASLAALHILTVTAPAMAQQPTGPDVVVLKDGNVLRGTLSEVVPGDHATLTLTNGQTATIKWEVIKSIEKSGVPAGTPPPVATTPPAGTGGSAHVHIDSDREVTLERQSNGTWLSACSAPCDADLPVDDNYRVVGSGIRASRPFRLAARPGERVYLTVDAASKGAFVGGIVLISIGAPVLLIGGLVLLVAAAADSIDGESDTSGARTVGWTMVGGGAAGIVVGIILLAGNSRTKTEQSLEGPARKGAWLTVDAPTKRLPTWREHVPAGVPGASTIPLFTGQF